MTRYEYKVVPAPRKGTKTKDAKAADAKLAVSVEEIMNEMGNQGWYYLRSDTLPIEERSGLTGKTTTFQHLLVFVRERADQEQEAPVAAPTITAPAPVIEPTVESPVAEETEPTAADDDESKT